MASTSVITTTTTIIISTFILLIATINTVIVTAVRDGELTVMFGVLRARGYHLFANAITTSDVQYDLKSNGNFTLLAPINSALFALDMTMPATNYVTTLRYHVIPRRMSMIDLLSLPPSSNSVPTLVPGRDVRIEQRRSVRSLITIGGVDVVVPGMFYGRNVAVHGLGGILEYRAHHSRNPPANASVTASTLSNLSGNFTNKSSLVSPPPPPPTPPIYNITGNYTFQFPVAIESPLSSHHTQNQTVSSPETSPPANGSIEQLHLSPNESAIHFASVEFRGEERMPRGKLLEVSSDGAYDHSSATGSTGGDDDRTVDCSGGDGVGDELNARIQPRRVNIQSNMIRAQ